MFRARAEHCVGVKTSSKSIFDFVEIIQACTHVSVALIKILFYCSGLVNCNHELPSTSWESPCRSYQTIQHASDCIESLESTSIEIGDTETCCPLDSKDNSNFQNWNSLIEDGLPGSWFIPIDGLILAKVIDTNTALPFGDTPLMGVVICSCGGHS